MIRFRIGPADGKILELRRAPLFLRVVVDSDGTVDALDQLDDEPKPTETIHVYRRDGEAGRGIACTRGKGCVPFVTADYIYHHEQPTDDEARNRERWVDWATKQAEAMTANQGQEP
jgi:hypothetical protein